MARTIKPKDEDIEIPVLPPFLSSSFDVMVALEDGTVERIPVMSKGRAMALQTACYSMTRWPPEKIAQIVSATVAAPAGEPRPLMPSLIKPVPVETLAAEGESLEP